MRNINAEKTKLPPELTKAKEQTSQQSATQYNVYQPPTDYVILPSEGRFYPEGHPLHGSEGAEVRFMTTKEEDILLSPAYNKKGTVIEKLIESILVTPVSVSSLFSGDRNAIMINARVNAYGNIYPIKVTCTRCLHEDDLDVDLEKITNKEVNYKEINFTKKGTFIIELPKTKVKVELKLLTSGDESEILTRLQQRTKHNLPNEAIAERYRQIVVSVNGKEDAASINKFIFSMPIADSRFLRKKHNEYTPDVDFNYEHICSNCEATNKGGVPITGEFFWPDE